MGDGGLECAKCASVCERFQTTLSSCLFVCIFVLSIVAFRAFSDLMFFSFLGVFDTLTVSARAAPCVLLWRAIVLDIDVSYLRGLSGGRSADG